MSEQDIEKIYMDFIATISHEIRTPLTSIRGFADTLINSSDKLTDEQKQKFLNIIKDQSNRLIKLVENLLSVSKIQSENENFVYKSVFLKPIIEQSIQIIKNQYGEQKFEFKYDSNVPKVLIDADKFQQVMINLIENACKYSDDTVKVACGFIQKNNSVSIKIIDNGIGIEEENYQKIFEKFSRIDNPLTRKVQGSGLGLYIAKNIIEKMNGKIQVCTKNGETIFEIELPVAGFDEQLSKKISRQG